MSPQAFQQTHAHHDLFQYDFILLNESRHITFNQHAPLFPGHFHFHQPRRRGFHGSGLTILVASKWAGKVSIWQPGNDPDVQCLWVKVDAAVFGTDRDVYIASCYVPPAGSPQVTRVRSLQDRYNMIMQHISHASSLGYVILGGDFNAHLGALGDAPIDELAGGQLPARSPVIVSDGSGTEVHNVAGQLLVDTCMACQVGVVTGRVQPDAPPKTSFTHRNTQSGGQSRPDHFLCSYPMFPSITTSHVMQHVGGSDHLPVSVHIQRASSNPQPQQTLLPCPPVLKWRGPEQLYSDIVQQAIVDGKLKAALDLLPEQGPAAATSAFLEVLRQSAVASGQRLLQRCKPQPPCRASMPWFDATCVRLRQEYRKQCTRLGAHHPEALRLLRKYKQRCQAKKRQHSQSAVSTIVQDAKHNPRMFWRRMPGTRSKQQVPSAGDPAECTQFFSGLFKKLDGEGVPVLPPGGPVDDHGMLLNEQITEQEVGVVLAALRTGCSSGSDGVPAEFFKCAVLRDERGRVQSYLMAPYLAQLFDWCFQQGTAPDDWGLALLSMIHKGGDSADWGNYRPIAVVQVISKMYAMVLSNRLHGWAESQGDTIRKPSQAGFRPVYNTTFNTFTLNHFIHKSKANRKPLYCCFVDLEKAYDSTPRDKLWQRLHHLGIRGRMLFAIAALYANVKYQIKFANGLSEVFGGDTGVRQGCPLSPFLFGVFVEMLHERIHHDLPDEGPTFDYSNPVHVPLLLFADDIALLSYSPQGLQRLLHCLSDFCDANHLTVSLRKTKVVIFHKSLSRAGQLQYTVQGKVVMVQDEYKYLGLIFGTGRALLTTKLEKAAASKGNAALAAVYRLFHSLHIQSNTYLKMKLFKAIVQPNLMYACEIWGTKLLALDPTKPFASQVDGVSTPFYKNLLGLKSGTSTWCLHREVGMYPWQLMCFRQMLRFVNKLRCMPETTLARMALCDAIADFRDKQHNNWFAQLVSFCDKIHAPAVEFAGVGTIPLFSEARCVACLKEVYHGVFTNAGTDQPKIHKYHTCFASPLPSSNKYWEAQPYLRTALTSKKASFLARFRLSSHHLACETGAWERTNGARNVALATKCQWCSTSTELVVQDEQHVFFDCPHFQQLRLHKPGLFRMDREFSLWRVFNEYGVAYDDIAWFLQETQLIYATR